MFGPFNKTGIMTVLLALLLILGVYLTAAKLEWSDLQRPEPATSFDETR